MYFLFLSHLLFISFLHLLNVFRLLFHFQFLSLLPCLFFLVFFTLFFFIDKLVSFRFDPPFLFRVSFSLQHFALFSLLLALLSLSIFFLAFIFAITRPAFVSFIQLPVDSLINFTWTQLLNNRIIQWSNDRHIERR